MVTNYSNKSHHFALTIPAADTTSGLAAGDIVGFNCIPDKDKGGAPFYKELDGQYLVNLFSNSQADQTAKNPEEELPIIMSDYTSFGLDIQDYDDPKRYFASYGADLRFKGRAMLSYKPTTMTLPATISVYIYEPGFEVDGAGWAGDGVRTTAEYHSGVASWKISAAGALSQTVAAYGTLLGAKAFTFKGWIKTATASRGFIRLNDGTTNFDSAYHTGGGGWEEMTVTGTTGAAATSLTISIRESAGGNVDIYFDDITLTFPPIGIVNPYCSADFNDSHYIGYGPSLLVKNAGGTAFTEVETLPYPIHCLEVMGDYLYITQRAGTTNANYWYASTALVFTESTAVVKTFQYFVVVDTTAPTMYGNDSVSTIRSTINPLNGGTAWSATTAVGSSYNNITGLFTKSGALYVGKEDMMYYLSSAGAVQNDLCPELEPIKSTTSCQNSIIFLDNIYIQAGTQALLEVGTTNQWISPSEYCTNLPAFIGRVQGLAHDDQWLFAVTYYDTTTDKVEVLAGRWETKDSVTSWVWHPIQEITLAGCSYAWVSSTDQKALYIASTSNSDSFYKIPLPTGYGDLASDSNRSYATDSSGYFETSSLHGGFMADTKSWLKVVATLGHAYAAGIYWQIQYKKLQDSTYTNIGNLVGTDTDRTHTLYLPLAGTANPVSTMMRFKLIGVTNSATTTPVLLNLDIRAILAPSKKDLIWAKVKIAKQISTQGGTSRDKYAKMKACLDKCRDATYPVTLKDIDGTTTQVRFLQLPQSLPWREPVTDEEGRDYDYVYNLLMLKTPTS